MHELKISTMILKSEADVITCQLCYLFLQDKDNLSFRCRLHVPSTSPFLEGGTFDLVEGHLDEQNRCITRSARQSVHHH